MLKRIFYGARSYYLISRIAREIFFVPRVDYMLYLTRGEIALVQTGIILLIGLI